MADQNLPPAAEHWLSGVYSALSATPEQQRAEILDGLRAHITDALQSGEDLGDVLARLGSASEIAVMAGGSSGGSSENTDSPPTPYWSARRWLQLFAFVLAVAVGVVVALLPSYVSSSIDSAGNLVNTQTNIALFSMAWQVGGSLLLAIAITAAPLVFRGAIWRLVSVACAAMMLVLAVASVIVANNWFVVAPASVSIVALVANPSAGSRPKQTAAA